MCNSHTEVTVTTTLLHCLLYYHDPCIVRSHYEDMHVDMMVWRIHIELCKAMPMQLEIGFILIHNKASIDNKINIYFE